MGKIFVYFLFKIYFQQVLGDEAAFLVDTLFRVFDDDGSGSIDFPEFILALNATKFEFSIKKGRHFTISLLLE